uniref:Uncharacterized protein n=1 Tax=Avena sativa TaxID=4498 RepID=A0ACD5YAF7_AVESA
MWISKNTEEKDTDSCLYPSDLESSPLAAAGSYQPAVTLAAARALRFVPYDAAVSTVRALLGASHEDLKLRVHDLSRSLSGVFLNGGLEPEKAPPFAAGVRFPEDALFVCADRAPLAPALREAARAMMQVAVKDAGHGPCDYYFDAVGALMLLLVGDAGRPAPEVAFSRETFESAFALQWVVPAPDAVVDDDDAAP